MKLLEKLDILLARYDMNRKKFSEASSIPYSTVSNWYVRGFDNMSIATFRTLCSFFHVTMDSMAYDDREIEYYNPDRPAFYTSAEEQELLTAFRRSDYVDQTSVRRTLGVESPAEKDGMVARIG